YLETNTLAQPPMGEKTNGTPGRPTRADRGSPADNGVGAWPDVSRALTRLWAGRSFTRQPARGMVYCAAERRCLTTSRYRTPTSASVAADGSGDPAAPSRPGRA